MSDECSKEADSLNRPSEAFIFVVSDNNLDAVRTVRKIRHSLSKARIVIISGTNNPQDVLLALDAGANGYLTEEITWKALKASIELVTHGQIVLPPVFIEHLQKAGILEHFHVPCKSNEPTGANEDKEKTMDSGTVPVKVSTRLSEREEAILRLLIDGAANKVIGQGLQIAEATVRVHLKSILRKICVKNRTQAAIWAIKHLAPSPAPLANRINGEELTCISLERRNR